MSTNFSVIELLGIVLGSNVVIEVVKQIFTRKQVAASAAKLKTEQDQLVAQGDLKLLDFYKEQIASLLERYDEIESKLNEKAIAHETCEIRLDELEGKYMDLQRQFTLFKSQVTGRI